MCLVQSCTTTHKKGTRPLGSGQQEWMSRPQRERELRLVRCEHACRFRQRRPPDTLDILLKRQESSTIPECFLLPRFIILVIIRQISQSEVQPLINVSNNLKQCCSEESGRVLFLHGRATVHCWCSAAQCITEQSITPRPAFVYIGSRSSPSCSFPQSSSAPASLAITCMCQQVFGVSMWPYAQTLHVETSVLPGRLVGVGLQLVQVKANRLP